MGNERPRREGATSRGVTNPDVSEADVAQDSRPCKGCGATIYRTVAVAPIKHYCGPECRPRCAVDKCDKPRHGKTYCSAHHSRWKKYGDPLTPMLRQSNVGDCSVEGCTEPSRKRGWCVSHYGQWRTTGAVGPFKHRWATPGQPCPICGKPTGSERGRRSVCSAACQRIMAQHGGPPANPHCARCGAEIDLLVAGKGRRKRADTKLCRRCRTQTRTEATPGELARRDGPYCQLCGCDVDLLARFPDPMRPSVDHIIPRAWGGSDAAENCQLTHLHCNHVKSDRYLGLSWRSMP